MLVARDMYTIRYSMFYIQHTQCIGRIKNNLGPLCFSGIKSVTHFHIIFKSVTINRIKQTLIHNHNRMILLQTIFHFERTIFRKKIPKSCYTDSTVTMYDMAIIWNR